MEEKKSHYSKEALVPRDHLNQFKYNSNVWLGQNEPISQNRALSISNIAEGSQTQMSVFQKQQILEDEKPAHS